MNYVTCTNRPLTIKRCHGGVEVYDSYGTLLDWFTYTEFAMVIRDAHVIDENTLILNW